ncbi:TPA: hypothetical protein DEO28_04220 [Candidatus Dependentiae bacterium]|nr:MAG: hypothetical protein UR14_C0006G0080 [candidate division TM6 bacterium GW2011_GWE2_31_21]KKP53497.1 MAG: hypothetical protein UR43_C0004G0038 [candidate division TM6 bacterium GW2011_GWF2_33_332]HBS48262.1 hypothetical protein [Candidatus Dependentiae bacterium]HBZ73689.1 hypothetical protein [Candidatus Dependentiae bacterium]
MLTPLILAYLGPIFAIIFSALGVAFGQGFGGFGALDGLERQKMGHEAGFRTLMIGLGITESGAILAFVAVILSIFDISKDTTTMGVGLARFGSGFAMGLVAAVVGFSSSMAVKEACKSIFRQPNFAQKITTFMLITQSIIEAPVIFAFIIFLIIKTFVVNPISLYQGMHLFAAALVIAFGCVGPTIGQGIFVKSACHSIGLNKSAYSKIFPFTLFSQAIIETPVIFSFIVSFLLIYSKSSSLLFTSVVSSLAAAIAMGFGAIGVGISTGYVASKACKMIAENPDNYNLILRNTLMTQAIIESSAIYSLVIALFVMWK